MPHTLQYRPVLIDALISNERIASYARVFRPSNDVELIGAYLWNVHVCSALYPLVSSVEIALRNAIDQALVADMGAFWWSASKLKYRSYKADAPPPRAVQAVHENFVKATRKTINEMRGRHHVRGRITPRHADVLAKVEFSTWGYLLDAEFMGRGLIWPKHLSAVFRGPWPVRRAGATLAQAHDLVATVREFRNRLFHHEPAWKRYGVHTEADALLHLHEKLDVVEKLLGLIHPENLRLLQVYGLLLAARRSCTVEEIRRFQHLAQVHRVESMDVLAGLVARCHARNETLAARLGHSPSAPFLISLP